MTKLLSTLILMVCYLSTTHANGTELNRTDFITQLRHLFAMQDAVAYGDRPAIEGQRQVLAELTKFMPLGLPEPRPTPNITGALAAYIFSGGQPADVESYVKRQELVGQRKELLQGAAAYMRGHLDDARANLASIDPLTLPPAYGGRIALTKAMLSDLHSANRQRYLSIAIALMPGTLVEEASLRRSVLSFAERGDATQFWRRTERYIRRFHKSVYAEEFLSGLARCVIEFHRDGRMEGLDELDRLYASLPVNRRRLLYLQLARGATVANVPDLAQLAGRRLFRLAVDGSSEQALGSLYTWAFAISEPATDLANARLLLIDRNQVEGVDRAILDAALEVINLIRTPAESPVSMLITENELPKDLRLLEERASAAMSSAEALLGPQ